MLPTSPPPSRPALVTVLALLDAGGGVALLLLGALVLLDNLPEDSVRAAIGWVTVLLAALHLLVALLLMSSGPPGTIQRSRQRRTMSDIRSLGTGFYADIVWSNGAFLRYPGGAGPPR